MGTTGIFVKYLTLLTEPQGKIKKVLTFLLALNREPKHVVRNEVEVFLLGCFLIDIRRGA